MWCITLIGILFWLETVNGEAIPQCNSPASNSFKLSILSRRNLTGHWNAQVELKRGAESNMGPLEVDIEHSTVKCGPGEEVLLTASVTAPPELPGTDYELVPGFGYYKYFGVGKNWQEAEKACESEGTHLLIVNSDEEYNVVKKIWDRHPSKYTDWRKNHVYLGLTDKAREGHYMTVLGKTINSTGYTRWEVNQPDGGVNEDCLLLTVNTKLHDVACHAEVAFICEREIY